MSEIKTCPFCGDKPTVRRIIEEYDADNDGPAGEYDVWETIECDHCRIGMTEEYRSEVIERWNAQRGEIRNE